MLPAVAAGDRAHVDDQSVAAGAQVRREGADGGELAAPVDREQFVDQVVVEGVQVGMRDGAREAGGIDQMSMRP